ncbi:MAG: AAA family ATPase [Acidobacteriaceae bacterium]
MRASVPAILFLDEIDILARDRAVSGNDSIVQEVIGQLLQEIDGIHKSTCEVFVLAATNRPESRSSDIEPVHAIDPNSLARPGRSQTDFGDPAAAQEGRLRLRFGLPKPG